MGKRKLNPVTKSFIVMCLATGDTPSEVVAILKKKLGVTMSRQAVQAYDPTKAAGKDLSEDLRGMFFDLHEMQEDRKLSKIVPKMKENMRKDLKNQAVLYRSPIHKEQ